MALVFERVEPIVRSWQAVDAGVTYAVTVTKQTAPDRYALEFKIDGNSQGTILSDTLEVLSDILEQVGGDLAAELGG